MFSTTLDEFMAGTANEEHDILYFSNWYTKWRHACEKAGIDPDEFEENRDKMIMKYKKNKRKRK